MIFGIREQRFKQVAKWFTRDEFLKFTSYDDISSKNMRGQIASLVEHDPIYHPSAFGHAKYQFPGLESIKENYSQSWQDMFVLTMHRGLRTGTYLELGASEPVYMNNTWLLEQFGWHGISIDFRDELESQWETMRPGARYIHDNALKLDFDQLLMSMPSQIDYLQVDLDETASLSALQRLPHHRYRFSVITFETDVFAGHQHVQQQAQEFLQSMGYQLVIKNVAVKNYTTNTWEPFEDWYIDPGVIDPSIAELFLDISNSKKLPHEIFIK